MLRQDTKDLTTLVKLWARRRGVYGKSAGRLSGYAFGQLALFFAALAPPQATLPELLCGFFTFYGCDFDWTRECVSVALGRRAFKAQTSFGSDHLSIEDFFARQDDLCAVALYPEENERLKTEFQRAAQLVADPEVSLDALLSDGQ